MWYGVITSSRNGACRAGQWYRAPVVSSVIVNVCPMQIANAPPDVVWEVLTDTERYGDWTDTEVVRVDPSGPASPGQHLDLATRALARRWTATIDIGRMDTDRRWIDMVARTFLFVNREHITLSPVDSGRTLVRFN